VNGYCATSGESCPLDGGACGAIGAACCATDPACDGNAYCAAGTCQAPCVTEVGLGRHFACVLEHDGSVWCSGTNGNGELANGSAGSPNASAFTHALDANGPIDDATAVCSGYQYACAVRAGGTVSCWGAGGNGQLGDNAYSDSALGVQVVDSGGAAITGMSKLACGAYHACALASDGTVWCWGDNYYGELGDNSNVTRATAAQISGLTGVASLQAGHYFVCSLDTGAQLRCWGRNEHGEIGDGASGNLVYAPEAITLANITAIATGPNHTCALLADTSVMCWGSNTRRWIGTGVSRGTDTLTPTAVLTSAGGAPYTGASAIALGSVSCALNGNNVDCWGDDVHGQSGNGGAVYPHPVMTGTRMLGKVDSIVAHFAHVCAHQTDDSLLCWGRNEEGEFGDGTFRNYGYPTPLGATCSATN
jgi:alpha-tubulin suppressor-like RCC1 family protein